MVEGFQMKTEHDWICARPDDKGDWVRFSDYANLQRQLAEMRAERDEGRGIVRDIYWMAVRYADGRKNYAVGMCNDALRKAYDAGWLVYKDDKHHDLDPQYARDGMFDVEWRSALDAEASRTEAAEAERDRLAAENERLRDSLRDQFCPRPCNGRPDHFDVGDCVDAGECGCSTRTALASLEDR